jgi:hypothetical protein
LTGCGNRDRDDTEHALLIFLRKKENEIIDKLGAEVQNRLLTSQSTVMDVQRPVPVDYFIEISSGVIQRVKMVKL